MSWCQDTDAEVSMGSDSPGPWKPGPLRDRHTAARARHHVWEPVPTNSLDQARPLDPGRSSPLVVHKYGGTSVAGPDKLRRVAERVAQARAAGVSVVVVVSAMGGGTDELLRLASDVSESPPARELDALMTAGERVSTALLAMALQELGVAAVSLDGKQCGVLTDGEHGRARIREIRTGRILSELEAGRVVVAAGFQGFSEDGEITTLGRGGSDTTATALAAALGARECHVFSDVDGVYTTDPRICRDARRLDQVGYRLMIDMARHGAGVLNPRAVEHARTGGVTIRARDASGRGGETVVSASARDGDAVAVAARTDLVGVTIGTQAAADALLAELGDRVPPFVPTERVGDCVELLLVGEELPDLRAFAAELEQRPEVLRTDCELGSISVLRGEGAGGSSRRLSNALEAAGVRARALGTTESASTALVRESDVRRAVRAAHARFATSTETVSCAG